MARRPYFSGNYGSALGSTANAANLIARAGETQGRMFANMGAQIGGMIQQYGLNKEKQKKNEGFIKSQSSMLDMLAEQDPDMAPQYASYKENLNNPDLPLSARVEFGKNLVNNITLSTQLQGQRLMQATQAQTLKERQDTENLRNELLKQKKAFNDLDIELKQLEADKGKALSDAEVRNILAKYRLSGKQIQEEEKLLPKRTEAMEAQLEAVPQQIKDDERIRELQIKGAERADESATALLEAFGGAEGKAQFDYKGAKLNRKVIKQGIEFSKKRGEYYEALSNKKVPVDTRKDYAAIQSNIGKLASSTLKDPQTGKQITFADYMDLNADDPELYPLTGDGAGPAATLYGAYITEQRLGKELLDSTQVQVKDPIDASTTTAQPTSIDINRQTPQRAMQTIEERSEQIRKRISSINSELEQLGKPGQMMPTKPTPPMGYGGFVFGTDEKPQTVGFIQEQLTTLPQEQANLLKELEQLEAQKQQLQNQIGIR